MLKNNFLKYKRMMVSLMILIAFAIVVFKLVDNIGPIFVGIGVFLGWIWKMIVPFAIGALIAFILNSSVNFIETDFANLFTKGRPNKIIRCISVTIVYLIAISLICLAGVYLVPAIEDSIIEFKNNLPANIDKAQTLIESAGLNFNLNSDIDFGDEISKAISEFIAKEGAVVNLLGNIASFTSALINGLLGIIISFYILVDKENLGAYIKKVILSFGKKEKADKFFEFCKTVTKTFDKFIIGKVVDSIIIGLLSYLGFLILGIKYRLIFAVIIGLTNIIPYVGPFMGAIPVGILVFLYNPAMTIPVLLLIFLLQQFDGSILGPKVLGDAIGVKPIAVIFAILVGGALGGVLGMFLAVPTYVVIADLVNKFIDERYHKNVVEKEVGKNE